MFRLTTITIFATIVFVIAATVAADSSTSTNSNSKSKTSSRSTANSKSSGSQATSSPLKKKYNPNKKIPPLSDFTKKPRPSGQELAKELKDRLKKTGSLSGQHHPVVEKTVQTANAKGKRVLLLFTSGKCKICQKMQAEALDVPAFKENFLKDFVVLNIDCDKQPEVAEHYLFTPLVPHYKIIDGNGKILKEKTGYDSDTKLADWLMEK